MTATRKAMDDANPANSDLADVDDPAFRAELLDRMYGLALDPSALPDLLDHWDRLLAPNWSGASGVRRDTKSSQGFLKHVRQVETLLIKTLGANVMRAEDLALLPYRRTVAFTLDRHLRVTAANRGARAKLGVTRGSNLSTLRARDEDITALSSAVKDLFRKRGQAAPRVIRARHRETDKPILVSLVRSEDEAQAGYVLVATTELHLSADRLDRLRDLLGLSAAEVEVLTLLTLDHSPAEIAALRNRSLNTVRTQMKSLMTKTESNSQSDLVRLALMTTVLPDAGADAGHGTSQMPVSRAGLELPELPFHRLDRPGGRKMDYLEFGDPKGRPLIYMCSNFGLSRWPADAELTARRTDIRVIVPIRPGYGWSDPLPASANRLDEVTRDAIALLDHLGIDAVHLLVLDEDMIFASELYKYAPHRVLGVLGCAAALPFTRPEQYGRMGRWHRFALGTARFAPHLFNFAVHAGFAMARQLGKAGFVRAVYAGSPSDIEVTRIPRVFDAIDCGSEIVLGDGVDAVDAYAQDVLLFHTPTWADDFRQMSRDIPVVDLIGAEDQSVAPQTRLEFLQDYPDVRIETLENAGVFVLFQHTFTVLQWMERLMGPADHLDRD
ncbi:alpha/beta fold hydrolase [Pseudooceanicola sp. MF1-13]|uniref:alpha/beta fold hydrolase n=1 Tax=Pseudooceanicola sp. MF1-13 TaxID=3379095 RepID=UPI0038913B44